MFAITAPINIMFRDVFYQYEHTASILHSVLLCTSVNLFDINKKTG